MRCSLMLFDATTDVRQQECVIRLLHSWFSIAHVEFPPQGRFRGTAGQRKGGGA